MHHKFPGTKVMSDQQTKNPKIFNLVKCKAEKSNKSCEKLEQENVRHCCLI